MAKVKVEYLGVIRNKIGKKDEEIDAENLGELIDEIGKRYPNKDIQHHLSEGETTDPSLVVRYNGDIVRDIRNYERELKDGDKIVLMTLIGGG